ncbi:MAG: hypothetical protein AABX47_08000 [Nanoarchaeota archaeon]
MKAVSNTSPLIFLAKIDRLSILESLFKKPVLVPVSVLDELKAGLRPELSRIENANSLFKFVPVKDGLPGADFLGKGEQHAMLLAKKTDSDVILLDDKSARIIAEALGLRVRGTAGLLLDGLREGYLEYETWRTLITDLVSRHDFRISIELYDRMMKEAEKYR